MIKHNDIAVKKSKLLQSTFSVFVTVFKFLM